jgi:glyoxylase I family protein
VADDSDREKPAGIFSLHGVRYQVTDVARAAAFYTGHLGFTLERQQLPAFASVSLGDFTLMLSGPGASGSRPMPGGESQQPGGWNRVVLRVTICRRGSTRSGTRG